MLNFLLHTFLHANYDHLLSPVSIQTQPLALRAWRKRKPQETQALALASSHSWLPLLRPSIPIGWRLCLLCDDWLLVFRAFFVYATHATHATQAIAFEWKPGFTHTLATGTGHDVAYCNILARQHIYTYRVSCRRQHQMGAKLFTVNCKRDKP